ncbi:ketopantoate reductase family protein [Caballeronia sp. INML1]|uniref:ketopantoate reductase family protein n=1 Tax=Caballeronia sp. INML1 TaxID=2921760 RepID=UPI002028A2B7|nr:2-dehydropantoate 2-reductase [Caballeronia sp. INML1]
MKNGLNILVLGAGAMGGYYGSRLIQAGADVTFLVRPGKLSTFRDAGLRVSSSLGDFSGPVNAIGSDGLRPEYDLVLLACKAYDLKEASEAIRPAMHSGSVILPLLNGIWPYDQLDSLFGKDRVAGGASYIAVTSLPDLTIEHSATNDRLVIGARSNRHVDVIDRFYEIIRGAPGVRALTDDIDQQLWQKWVMLSAGASATCLMRANIGEILATSFGAAVVRQLLAECLDVAAESRHQLDGGAIAAIEGLLLDRNSTWASSMLRDIRSGATKIETHAIVGDMVKRAESFSIEVPGLRMALAHLEAYEAQQRL